MTLFESASRTGAVTRRPNRDAIATAAASGPIDFIMPLWRTRDPAGVGGACRWSIVASAAHREWVASTVPQHVERGGTTHGVLIRPARPDECELLSELALRSKGCWGYDAEFLEACRAELTLAPEDLARLTVRVVERTDGHVIAFYALGPLDGSAGEVCFFFVDPPFMGTGIGRRLFEDLLATARSAEIRSLRIEADPGAASFYERMGAARVGETPSSSIPGRVLPTYQLTL
jgi:GNAT superfamily N-acetyltransferase